MFPDNTFIMSSVVVVTPVMAKFCPNSVIDCEMIMALSIVYVPYEIENMIVEINEVP